MKFELNEERNGYTLVSGDDVPTVVIPQEYDGKPVTSIGDNAFYGCMLLTSITIPDSVTSIGNYAFYKCTSLTSVTIGNSVTSIGQFAFADCTSLTSITIPDSVTSIGSYTFASCKLLTSIIVSESNVNYKSIDGNLYSKDRKTLIQYAIGKTAKEFIIPDSVTSIGVCAFSGCTSLTSVTIPDGVTSISAFYKCTSLTSIAIPDSVTSIGVWAFEGCTSLKSVYYNGDTASWDKITFGNVWANPLYYGATLHTEHMKANGEKAKGERK